MRLKKAKKKEKGLFGGLFSKVQLVDDVKEALTTTTGTQGVIGIFQPARTRMIVPEICQRDCIPSSGLLGLKSMHLASMSPARNYCASFSACHTRHPNKEKMGKIPG